MIMDGQVSVELLGVIIAIGTGFVAWLKHLIDRERKAREEIESLLKGRIVLLEKEVIDRRERLRECHKDLEEIRAELAYLRGTLEKHGVETAAEK